MTQLALDLEPELAYTLVVSRRARRASLRVAPGRGLIVTIPRWFARRDVPELVDSHRQWAEAALSDLEQKTPPHCRTWPPEKLVLQAIDRTIRIRFFPLEELSTSDAEAGKYAVANDRDDVYAAALEPAVLLSEPSPATVRWRDSDCLDIQVDVDDRVAVATAIAQVIKHEARRYLIPLLASHAAHHDLTYKRAAIRGQRTVWGSYSSSGTLSLNYKLLFLRRELVDYVLLHELAHTRHLDHSPAFWKLLTGLQVNARKLDKELLRVESDVPPWLELAI